MQNQTKFLYRTNYFQREWTWIRRIFAMMIFTMGVFMLPLEDDLLFLKFIAAGLVIFYLIAKPKDDLAVTDKLLLHIRRSVIKQFTRIDRYEISELTSIRCRGIHSDGWEIVEVFSAGHSGGTSNSVEMTFRNGESKSLELAIARKKLDTIVKIVYDLKRRTAV